MKNEIVLFEAKDGSFAMPVQVKAETVWLTQAQMAQLFNKDRTVIGRHCSDLQRVLRQTTSRLARRSPARISCISLRCQ